MAGEGPEKLYLDVIAEYRPDGTVLPLAILWEDGRRFPIDKVLDVRPAASLKCGGAGLRYRCRIGGHERFLFLDEQQWFAEKTR